VFNGPRGRIEGDCVCAVRRLRRILYLLWLQRTFEFQGVRQVA